MSLLFWMHSIQKKAWRILDVVAQSCINSSIQARGLLRLSISKVDAILEPAAQDYIQEQPTSTRLNHSSSSNLDYGEHSPMNPQKNTTCLQNCVPNRAANS